MTNGLEGRGKSPLVQQLQSLRKGRGLKDAGRIDDAPLVREAFGGGNSAQAVEGIKAKLRAMDAEDLKVQALKNAYNFDNEQHGFTADELPDDLIVQRGENYLGRRPAFGRLFNRTHETVRKWEDEVISRLVTSSSDQGFTYGFTVNIEDRRITHYYSIKFTGDAVRDAEALGVMGNPFPEASASSVVLFVPLHIRPDRIRLTATFAGGRPRMVCVHYSAAVSNLSFHGGPIAAKGVFDSENSQYYYAVQMEHLSGTYYMIRWEF